MKFKKYRCQTLLLGQRNARDQYKLGEQWLESSPAERSLGVLVDSRLNVSQQCGPAAQRASPILGFINHSIPIWSSEVMIPLYSVLVWPHLDYCMQF